jgi:hypothetical protein
MIYFTFKLQVKFKGNKITHIRSALFWDITQRRVVILYQRFGTTYRSHLQGSRSPRTWTLLCIAVQKFYACHCLIAQCCGTTAYIIATVGLVKHSRASEHRSDPCTSTVSDRSCKTVQLLQPFLYLLADET